MSVYFGNDTVNDLYVGLTPVTKGYVGTQLFYNGENTIIDTAYEKYILNTQFSTLYNTAKKPVKSAILKGNTGYRDIDTGEFLETFEEGRNLELVSVKMPVLTTTGKNLFNFKTEEVFHGWLHNKSNFIPDVGSNCMTTDYIQIKENVKYSHNGISMGFYDHNKKAIGDRIIGQTMVSPSNAKYMRVTFEFDTVPVDNFQYVIGEWSEYEPYKTNILSTSEDVTLRGVGGVQDELNCLTGEVTQRIVEIVLDGSEDWLAEDHRFTLSGVENLLKGKWNLLISDKYSSYSFLDYAAQYDSYIMGNGWSQSFSIRDVALFPDPKNQLSEFKEYLSQNPVTVRYQSATESIKTVDLSVVDQDGKNTKLSTFNDITYVTLSSERLIPGAELEVATKNEEVLNTMSLEMDDISATQTTLEETSNAQGENVDATMIATTEIYEQLL